MKLANSSFLYLFIPIFFFFPKLLLFEDRNDLRIDPDQPLVVGDEQFRERLRGDALEGANPCPIGDDPASRLDHHEAGVPL